MRRDAYADTRAGTVAFAVRTDQRLWGRDLDRRVQSASVVKALLLVAYLRERGPLADLTRAERHPLSRWCAGRTTARRRRSSRGSGRRGSRLAHRAGMPSFGLAPPSCWGAR